MRYVIAATLTVILTTPNFAHAQRSAPVIEETPLATKQDVPDAVQRIVASPEFQLAIRSKNFRKMKQLLAGTGAFPTTPVALFYCRPPAVANYINGSWYCSGLGIDDPVRPFMYLD